MASATRRLIFQVSSCTFENGTRLARASDDDVSLFGPIHQDPVVCNFGAKKDRLAGSVRWLAYTSVCACDCGE
jgi:hypothetical protein